MGPNYERNYMPDEDDAIVHYGPGDRPLCGNDAVTTVFTDDPALVAGCVDCLELATKDLDEDNEHWANCLHCQQEISARNGVEWRRIARALIPYGLKLQEPSERPPGPRQMNTREVADDEPGV